MPQTITSVEGFIRKLRHTRPAADEVLFYRGHSDRRTYRLLPSVLRNAKLAEKEHEIVRELIAAHPSEFSADQTMVEKLARMQHYALPTRLLDVTANPLVSLYFAASENDGQSGEVIMLRVKHSEIKFFDSDTASCISNLSLLTWQDKQALDFSLNMPHFNATPAVGRLLHFIRDEKPYFQPGIILPSDLRRVLCIKTKFNSKRILAQAGAFLLFGATGELDTNPTPGITVDRIKINGNKKMDLIEELDRVGINESTMFPEIESAAKYISKKFGR